MLKLVMMKGLPGSGKSTKAFDMLIELKGKGTRVNKDDIRAELEKTGWKWSREGEKFVVEQRDTLIYDAFNGGSDVVISDDTNLAPKHEAQLRFIAKRVGASFEIQDLTHVPIEECIRRDSIREGKAKVGEKVIKDMATQFLGYKEEVKLVPYVDDPSLPPCIICDLDGTLAIHQGRSPYEYGKCDTDKINEAVRECIWAMRNQRVTVIFLSGREDYSREMTSLWINSNVCGPAEPLFMRKTGDHRSDTIIKQELFDAHIRGKYRVLFCLDDRDRVVKLWRDLGLACFQVNYGSF